MPNEMKETQNGSGILDAPKVSIVVPCYNVEKYIEQCIDSIVSQTLRDIEIICVNDGSTDGTPDILAEFAAKDSRISIINKSNSGYGDSMNKGFAAARGEYVGIVESDDFVEPEMFETLYNSATEHDADVVKSNFFLYWSDPEKNKLFEYFSKDDCLEPIKPGIYDGGSLYGRKPSIWSAIYKRSFIEDNDISFLPTPGASYQDTSFTFKVYSTAKKMVCLYDAFLHYRQDNENSSVNNADKKMHCIFDEYNEIRSFIDECDEEKQDELYPIYAAAFYDTCIWMYESLTPKSRHIFLKKISPMFRTLIEEIGVDRIKFGNMWWKYRDIVRIAENPYEYHMWRNDERYDQNAQNMNYPITSTPPNNLSSVLSSRDEAEAPAFSVIIPVYNVEKYLPSALDSLMYQTFEDIEIICINDGSTDHSLSVLEQYAKMDERLVIINQENSGPSTARNNGLLAARGEYVLFLDSDDYLSVSAFETLRKAIFEKNAPDAVEFGGEPFPTAPRASEWLYSILSTPEAYFETVDPKMFLDTSYLKVYCWRYCYKRSFLQSNELNFSTKLNYGEDALFLMSALPKMKGLYVIPDKLYFYRHIRTGSLMNQIAREHSKYAAQQQEILEQMLDLWLESGYEKSAELLQYSCDFVYSSIDRCPQPEKTQYVIKFLALLKKYGLDKYVDESSDNCRGFYNYCVNVQQNQKHERSFGVRFKHFMAKVVPPSRNIFYEHSSRIIDIIDAQQQSINLLQRQVSELQAKLDKRL